MNKATVAMETMDKLAQIRAKVNFMNSGAIDFRNLNTNDSLDGLQYMLDDVSNQLSDCIKALRQTGLSA